jgi:hypothetical protein
VLKDNLVAGHDFNDKITYLPIDRSRSGERRYAETDARERRGMGGIRYGKVPFFSKSTDLPSVTEEGIKNACSQLLAKKNIIQSTLYLNQIGTAHAGILFKVLEDQDLRAHWSKLWLMSGHLARLSRFAEGKALLVPLLAENAVSLNFLHKFKEHGQTTADIFLKRVHDDLLKYLFEKFYQAIKDKAKAKAEDIKEKIEETENREDILRKCMPAQATAKEKDKMLNMLTFRRHRDTRGRLRSQFIREKLEAD